MIKKILALLLILLCFAGCKQEEKPVESEISSEISSVNSNGIPFNCVYYIAKEDRYLESGASFPTPQMGDKFFDYNQRFEYAYKSRLIFKDKGYLVWEFEDDQSVEGWAVSVLDRNQERYGKMKSEIAGEPVVSINSCFYECRRMTSVASLSQNLLTMENAFLNCEKLKGEIELYGEISSFKDCFKGTKEEIVLLGDSDIIPTLKNEYENIK